MFKRFILFITFLLILSTSGFAEPRRVQSMLSTSNATDIAVASTATVFTQSFPMSDVNQDKIGVVYKCSTSSCDMNIKFEQGYQRPTTEGSDDSAYFITDVINASLTDNKWHMATVSTVTLPYGRFKVIGQGSNPSNATLKIKVSKP